MSVFIVAFWHPVEIIVSLVEQSSKNSGMALLLVLVLIGLAAVLTISAQLSTALGLKVERIRQQKTVLKIAAADMAWNSLSKIASGGQRGFGTGDWSVVDAMVLPNEAQEEVRVKALPESSHEAAMLSMAGYPRGQDKLLVLESTASSSASDVVQMVSCLLERDNRGRTEILGWLEQR